MQGENMQVGMILNSWEAKKLVNCSDAEIAKRLSSIYFLIGLRPQHFPTKEEDKIIFTYIRTKFGHRTIDELYNAFDLAINQQLELEENFFLLKIIWVIIKGRLQML